MWWHLVWLCLAAFLAGVINALAGGGTLLTFPALFAGLSAATDAGYKVFLPEQIGPLANGTSTVALLPASLSSAWAYREELGAVKRWLWLLVAPSIIGGVAGSLLVIWFPKQFNSLVPWLILTATVLFLIQPLMGKWLGHQHGAPPSQQRMALVVLMQLGVALYGGYFGAGIGILMLSALGVMGLSNMHEMNALKTVLGSFINGTAVMVFLVSGTVYWPFAIPMIIASITGGYFGAKYGRRAPSKYVRYLVLVVGFGLTTYYFAKPLVAKYLQS